MPKKINKTEAQDPKAFKKKLTSVLSVIFFSGALTLASFNMTGFAIQNAQYLTKWAGILFFVLGLVFAFIHVRECR